MATETKIRDGLYNTSEIGRLRRVMVHRPGRELENLAPGDPEQPLFGGVPNLEEIQEEHDAFARCLEENGAEVVYLHTLAAETVSDPEVRGEMVEQFLDEAGVNHHRIREMLRDYFADMGDEELVESMMAGVRKSEIRGFETGKLADYMSWRSDGDPFLIYPMPNLYFVRDPFAAIGNGVSLHRMHAEARDRETIFGKYIFKYHPRYKDAPKWYISGEDATLEGGDILVLSPETIAVGVSQSTERDGAARLAHAVLSMSETFREVLAFDIPKGRQFMHLDTALAMVDRDKFLVRSGVLENPAVQVLTLGEDNHVQAREEQGPLEEILKRHLRLDSVTLIPWGGGADGGREQWGGVLTVAPGEVIACAGNRGANRALEEAGVTVHTVPCGRLSPGWGGPRCVSMPFVREDL